MTIVFAENFQNDTPATYGKRYQGSTYNLQGATSVANAWPLASTGWLQTSIPLLTSTNTRFEALLTFQDSNQVGVAVDFSILGLAFKGALNALTINGAPCPSLKTTTKLNIIIERKSGLLQLIVVADDVVVITPTIIEWTPDSSIGGTTVTAGFQANLPNFMTSLVIAYDTPVGTRLNSSTFTDLPLTVTAPGDWAFSDVGYIEDTNKTNPTLVDPNINTLTDTSIILDVDNSTSEFVGLYANRTSDQTLVGLSVEGITYPATTVLTVAPKHQLSSSTFTLSTTPIAGVSNDDNVTFLGERTNLITYADFCTELNFTAGILSNAANKDAWLEFVIDGTEVIVAETYVRYNLSFNNLYSAGLVYGVDGPGTVVPASVTPINQLRTIILGGKTYAVRLMSASCVEGFNTGPSGLGSDAPVVRRSEYARLMYPISDQSIPSYTGPKLAAFTYTQFGLATTNYFIFSDASSYSAVSRCIQNSVDISTITSNTESSANSLWRPILVRVA